MMRRLSEHFGGLLLKYFFYSIALFAAGTCTLGCNNTNELIGSKRLYRYSHEEIDKRAQDYGYSDKSITKICHQNSEGTKIYFGFSESEQGKGRVLVFTLNDKYVAVKDLPNAYNIWLDEAGDAAAWWVIGEPVVHLANGDKLEVNSGSSSGFQVDPSGRLAAAYDRSKGRIELYQLSSEGARHVGAIEDAKGWLGSMYLGPDRDAYIECFHGSEPVYLYVLTLENDSYILKNKISLTGAIVEADVESGWLFLRESHDLGFGKRHLYNFRTGEYRSLGRIARGIPFFLQGDIINRK